jgi:cephalosporin-C deacetylase-like acetyl esterase
MHRCIAWSVLACALAASLALAQTDSVPAPSSPPDLAVLPGAVESAAPRQMMHNYLLRLAREAFDRRDAQFEKLKTPEQVEAYQQSLRDFFVTQLGGFPARTPLRPQIVAKENRDGYRIEKIVFESQPRHFVTAVLYLPATKPPYPAVLVPCGHSDNGKAAETYQRACILLAKNGLAALCYDPIDQGERCQLLDDGGKPVVVGTTAHCLLGVGSILLGRNAATFRVWDGMRGIDYLQSRSDIDPRRIGCTGNSGGGTLTSYLMALDERIVCAAPSCYLTDMRRLLETIGPQDAEQIIHAQIARGMDHADYVLMRAPRPTLMATATHDYFDIGGAWNSFRQAKRIYTRLGCAERVDLIEADEKHGFSSPLRVGAVRWMRRWLLNADDAIGEPEAKIATDQEMLCTPRGQVMLLEGARSTYDLNKDYQRQLAQARKEFWRKHSPTAAQDEVRRIAGIRKLTDLIQPKVEKLGTIEREGYRIEKLVLRPEEGIVLPALAFIPAKPGGEATLYLHAAGKQADAAPGGPIETLVKKGQVVLAVDLRGLGETQATGSGGYAKYLGPEWADGFLAYMLDKSYLGMRTEDILVCARFLQHYESGGKPRHPHLISIGAVGPPAVHAAALHPQLFSSLRLKNCLTSWASVVDTPLAKGQFVNVVHGALKVYDLPDLLAALPEEHWKLEVVEPLDALQRVVK